MDRHQIRLGHTDSVNSVDKENFLGVQLKSTSKKLHFNDIKTTIDQYEQFKKERAESTKYRLILTINPYCTNVLFNPLTEVCKIDENGKVERYFTNDDTVNGIDGGDTPLRVQMVCNTEYSKETPDGNGDTKYGYTYMPGYDIFDNHILRNKRFKIVEPSNRNLEVFNTLADYYRNANKTVVKFGKRISLDTKPQKVDQHLYGADDIFTFEESVNANLTDENGWFGFINASNLKTTGPGEDGELSKISCVINYKKNCEFIDMYPDRTTFTFSPYYNKVCDRLENNWDVFVTYAYDIDECNPLVGSETVKSGLAVLSVTKNIGITGEDIYVFRCYTKHNLKRGDMFKVFTDSADPIGVFSVANVGDTGSGDSEYYFYVDAIDFPEEVANCGDVRIRKVYNGMDSSYYVRKLKKIKKIEDNTEKDLNVERYKLAFASTIYDDDTTQFTFTDDIDITNLKDGFGRPITELFITIVKTNKGNTEWYSDTDKINASDVEISHCFGPLTCGFVLSHEKNDAMTKLEYSDGNTTSEVPVRRKLEWMHDARVINNNDKFDSRATQIPVTSDDDDFLCDVVEFSPEDCLEHVLSECAYRFNTYQRETRRDEGIYQPMESVFTYHEIKYDDEDVVSDSEFQFIDLKVESNDLRDEGYYYKANYSIPIRDVSDINQSGHKEIRVKSVKPVYTGSIILSVTASLPSRLNVRDTVYLCDDKGELMFEFTCVEVKSPTVFLIEPKISWGWFEAQTSGAYNGTSLNWLKVSQLLSDGSLKLRGKNYDIPDYAYKVGTNTYMWRDVLYPGQKTESQIPEYTFTNDAFYLTPIIRFYLKRQDPDNSIGLQAKDMYFPNDVFGNIQKQSKYYYEDEPQDLC